MAVTEKATTVVDVDGKQASEMLNKLEKDAKQYRDAIKQATKAGDLNAWKKNNDALKKVNKDIRTLKKSTFDTARVLKNLNGTSLADLERAKKALVKEVRSLNRGTDEYVRKSKDLQRVTGEVSKVKGEMFGVTKQSKGFSKSLGGLRSLLPTLGIGALVTSLFRAGKALLELNMQMEQNARKARLVLGPAYNEVTTAAKENAKAIGLTNLEYRDAVTNISDLLVPLDFTRKQSADMAQEVIKLAGAFSEWSGGMYDAREVSEDLNKAILGEMEGMKKYGIAIRKDSEEFKELVKQKYADGAATKSQAEALAAYELILKKSADAQSSFNQETDLLIRKKKDVSTWWRSFKEGAAEAFALAGKQMVYMGDNFDLAINRMKKSMNDFAAKLGKDKLFEIESLEAFSNAILETDQRFVPFIKRIEEAGLQTKEGKKEWLQMAQALEKAYGQEGIKIATDYYKKQKELIRKQQEAWETEEEAVIEANKKKLEVREQQEMAAFQKMNENLKNLQLQYFSQQKNDELKHVEELYKQMESITLDTGEVELALLEEHEMAKQQLRRQYGLISLEEEKQKELDLVLQGYVDGLLSYEEYELAKADIANYYRELKIEQDLLDEEEEIIKKEEELAALEKDYKTGLINEIAYNKQKAAIVKKYADEERKTIQEKFQKFNEYAQAYGNSVSNVLSALSGNYEAQKQRELKAAGNNAKEKEKIEKEYAKKQKNIALTQAIINTALGVTSALSGPYPLSLVMAVLAAAAGAIEIATISSQQFAKGKYSVRGADDGRLYNATMSSGTTGVYSEPTITPGFGLYGETAEPEMVIDGKTFRNIQMNTPDLIPAIMAHRVPQYAAGDYSSVSTSAPDISRMEELLEQNIAVNSRLTQAIENPPPALAVMDDKSARDVRERIQRTDEIEASASRN